MSDTGEKMKIIIDAMGGDNAPGEIVKGAFLASQKYKSKFVLVGNQAKIEEEMHKLGADSRIFDIVHTECEISMEDDPLSVVRSKKDSSMSVGLHMLKEDGDAFISAGNTGALHVGSSLIVRPLKGIQRSCIATVLPFGRPMLMLDCGANVNVTADYLVEWAIMGQIYMKNIFGVKMPTVGLLNNGTEEHKGTQIQIDAYKKLTDNELVNFIGNIEGKDVPLAKSDVLVTDGFTGNVTLKLIEGMSKFFFGCLRDMYTKNALTKMSYTLVKDSLRGIKNDFDPSEYGGSPLLGLKKPVIKAHGSSDARAVMNAVRQAESFIKTGVIDEIGEKMRNFDRGAKSVPEKTAGKVN